jgi:hypothetical protein
MNCPRKQLFSTPPSSDCCRQAQAVPTADRPSASASDTLAEPDGFVRGETSFFDSLQHAIDEFVVQEHPGADQSLDQRTCAICRFFFERRTRPSDPMTGIP